MKEITEKKMSHLDIKLHMSNPEDISEKIERIGAQLKARTSRILDCVMKTISRGDNDDDDDDDDNDDDDDEFLWTRMHNI